MHIPKSGNRDSSDEQIAEVCTALRTQVDALAQEAASQSNRLPAYAAGLVDPEQLKDSGVSSIGLILSLIGGVELSSEQESLAYHLGNSRADLGVPVDELLRALNIDFEVVWSAITRSAPDMPASVVQRLGVLVWQAVEAYSNRVLLAYKERERQITEHSKARHNILLQRLLATDPLKGTALLHTLEELGFDPAKPFTTIAHPLAENSPLMDRPSRSREGIHRHTLTQTCGLTLWQSKGGNVEVLLHETPCVFEDEVTADQLQASLRAVALAYSSAGKANSVIGRPLRSTWLDIAIGRLDGLQDHCAQSTLGPLLEQPVHVQDRLYETLEALYEHGSVAGAASASFTHRNTINQRIRTVQSSTGLDPQKPKDLSLLIMAFRCKRPAH